MIEISKFKFMFPLKKRFQINLSASQWDKGQGVYFQNITIPELGDDILNQKIELEFTDEIINQLKSDGVEYLYINNNNGFFTAVAVGASPSITLAIPATATEI